MSFAQKLRCAALGKVALEFVERPSGKASVIMSARVKFSTSTEPFSSAMLKPILSANMFETLRLAAMTTPTCGTKPSLKPFPPERIDITNGSE